MNSFSQIGGITIKKLLLGITLSVLLSLSVGFFWEWKLAINITGGIGVIMLLLAGILNGTFISGVQMRANRKIESAEDKELRNKLTSTFFLLGFPFFLMAIALFFVVK
ncbi:DUF5316 family protein [Paenibacillus lentus]|uniref:DUF5316 domain-containing protein n=1 Tax=Paenibacillus lentus TaxID=1338368 RepID=A0A3S8RYD4_9BACL|nr:DUF5316 family protein [Paenibacillus lentus]AZK47919.1 hypothetical protein EIM92_18560 [Paenibacillus lentus]